MAILYENSRKRKSSPLEVQCLPSFSSHYYCMDQETHDPRKVLFSSSSNQALPVNPPKKRLVFTIRRAPKSLAPPPIENSDITVNERVAKKKSKRLKEKKTVFPLPLPPENEIKSLRLKAKAKAKAAAAATAKNNQEIEKKKAKFSVMLSREEIEDDFVAMTGFKPKRLPKKRRTKAMETLFPSSTLSKISLDSYKVRDFSLSKR